MKSDSIFNDYFNQRDNIKPMSGSEITSEQLSRSENSSSVSLNNSGHNSLGEEQTNSLTKTTKWGNFTPQRTQNAERLAGVAREEAPQSVFGHSSSSGLHKSGWHTNSSHNKWKELSDSGSSNVLKNSNSVTPSSSPNLSELSSDKSQRNDSGSTTPTNSFRR